MARMKSHGMHGAPHASRGDQDHKRKAMSADASQKQFKRTASHVHKKNLLSGAGVVNRGGIRL